MVELQGWYRCPQDHCTRLQRLCWQEIDNKLSCDAGAGDDDDSDEYYDNVDDDDDCDDDPYGACSFKKFEWIEKKI